MATSGLSTLASPVTIGAVTLLIWPGSTGAVSAEKATAVG